MHIAASAGAEKALRIAALKAKRDALQAESVAKRARSNPLVTPEEEARERARISDAAIRKKGLESALGSGTPADSVFSAFNYLRQPARACQLRRPPFSLTRCDSFFLALYFVCFRSNAIVLGNPSGDEIVFPLICYFFVLLCSRYHATGFSSVSLVRYLALLATMRCSSAVAAKRLRPRLMHYRQEPCGLATSILRLSFPNIMPFWVRPKNLANLCVVCPDYYIVCICSIISSDRQPVSH